MSVNTKGRRFRILALASAIATSVLLLGIAQAAAQGRYEHGGPLLMRGYEAPTSATVKKGYLFIDGEYLAPPYEIRFADESLTVNGRTLTCVPPQRGFGGRGYGMPRSESSWRWALSELHGYLNNDCVVMSFADQPFVVLDSNSAYELLKSMTSREQRSLRQVAVMEKLPEEFNKQVWDDWISEFDPPEELKQRGAVLVASFDATQREALADIRARRWMETLTYPLSVTGMVMSVLAIGHLLGGRPHAGKPTFGVDAAPELIYALNWSLFFAAAFSSLDLVWTILAASTNQMRELNPLGSLWIEDPRHLAGFKVAVTFSCLALLWLLRKHKRAQIAAWWVCLVLTLVTCRWLMINTLFVSA